MRKSRMLPNAIIRDSAVGVGINCHEATIAAALATAVK
jgi:hypothetical protein